MPLALIAALVAYGIGIAILCSTLTGCTAPDPKQAFNPMGKAVEELNKKAQAAIEAALHTGGNGINPLVQDSIFLLLGRAAYYQGQMAQAKA